MSALPPVLARLPISAFPPATAFNPTDIALFTQGSTGPGTGTTRKLLASQMFGAPIPIGDITPNTGAFTALSGLVTATGSPTARTLADRAADWANVKDFGAVLNGTTNDTAAINAARTATPVNGTVRVPAGGWFNNTTPVGGPSTPILWQMTGNCFTTGTTPVTGIGTDTVESFVVGSKYFGRGASVANMSPVFRVDQTISHNGGTSGFVMSAAKFNTTVTGNTANFGYGVTSVTHSISSGGGNTVAVAGYAYKDANGDIAFGGNFLATDTTGNGSSVSGAIVGTEFDIVAAGGADDGGVSNHLIPAGSGVRVGVDVVGYRTAGGISVAEIGYLVRAGAYTPNDLTSGPWPSTAQYAKRVFTAIGAFSVAAYDASLATAMGNANAFRMASDQTFAFDGTTNSRTLSYVSADTALEYKVAGSKKLGISDVGLLTAPAANFAAALASSPTPALQAGGNINGAAGAFKPAFNSQIGLVSGTMPNATNLLNVIQTQTDNSATTGENVNLGVYYTVGGAGLAGARANARFVFTFTGNTTNPSVDTFHRNVAITSAASAIDGGTALDPNSNWFGVINDVALKTGAMYWNSLCGMEIDTSIESGASAKWLIGLQLVQKSTHVTKASDFNAALSIANQTGGSPPGYDTAITFGAPNGVWAPATTMIGTTPTALSGPAYAAVNGIDFSAVTFSGSFLKSVGFSVDGSGNQTAKSVVNTGARADQSADVFVATVAGSRTIPNECSWECLTPAGTIATFTTTMPAAPIDKQEVWISTTNAITTWTLSPNTGQTINGAPTTLAANTSVMFRYNLATTAWFRMI